MQKQKVIRNATIGSLALVLALAFVLLFGFTQKRKANILLEKTLQNLKSTQDQLVKSEKMAAFGVLAARVAHEIENPLNFVNNFSELSDDLINEISGQATEEDKQQAIAILKENLRKINLHGKRADSIVKQLQEHIRSGTAYKYFENDKT